MGALELGFAMAELALKYGVPLAVSLAATWNEQLDHEPTKADFEALRAMAPAPESYFPPGTAPGTE